MKASSVVGLAVAAAAAAGVIGFLLGRAPGDIGLPGNEDDDGDRGRPSAGSTTPERGSHSPGNAISDDRSRRERRRRQAKRRPWRDRDDDEGARDPAAAEEQGDDETPDSMDPERLSRDLEACLEERVELLGKPIKVPGDPEDRFRSTSVSSGVRSAMDQAGVAGEVEATDCSEHPCIVFGRLEGDEEDMEKIERAEALAPYESDVLSLLFWATSVDDPAAPADETGLFALAFYTDADRQELGDELDRRIRARVMEYWNTDKPGLPSPSN